MVFEQELASHSFSEKDAIFVTDAVQIEFLKSASNTSLSQGWMFPLSTQAYAAILRLGHKRVRSYFELIDFAECKRWYTNRALECSKTWLKELDLEFQIEGIDIAELDAACQFLLFVHAVYIQGTAERLIRASPEIETFYIVVAENRLPLDFYFDSDVSAAVLRFVCESLGCRVRTIVMKQRPRLVFPHFRHRPIMSGRVNSMISGQPALKIPRSSPCRIGFAPATVANYQQILNGIRRLACHMVVFPSIWPTGLSFDGSVAGTNECVYHLSAADGEWSATVVAELVDLRTRFLERRALSTLPNCIIDNPHLDFQFDYIFTQRWLSYANMIWHAVRFVAETPLDLFIHSDHFTAEGAILARLYRRRGTRVIVTLHSDWPCDRNWASWTSSDCVMVPSKTCADKIRALSGVSDVFVTGAPTTRTRRSLIYAPALIGNKKRVAGRRKVVLLVTNALELNCFPFTALDSHFETISSLGRVPESLKDRILVVIRTKPGTLGEDPILYGELCGLLPESFTFLDGLNFSHCVEVADCVVGINIPTSGYFEIMRKGVPLIHVQTSDVISLQPDLPAEIIQRVTEFQGIWPAIEAALFDERQRQTVIEIQRRFVAFDFRPTVRGDGDPVEALILRLLGSRSCVGLNSFLSVLRRRIVGRLLPTHRSPPLALSCLPQYQQGGAGHVDDILLESDGAVVIVGWAADMVMSRPAKAILVFLNGLSVGGGVPGQHRPDVAAAYSDERLEPSGFSVHLALVGEEQVAALLVYAELHDGRFFELQRP